MSNEGWLPERVKVLYFDCANCGNRLDLEEFRCKRCGQLHLSPKVIYAVREDRDA